MQLRSAYLVGSCLAVLAVSAPGTAGAPNKKPNNLRGLPLFIGPVRTVPATGPNAIGLGAVSSATATCPSGTQAVSGGFSAPANGTNTLGIYESYRSSPQTWTVSGHTLTANGGAATAFAYCAKLRKATITEVTSTAIVPSGGGQSATASASCDPEPWTSGGFQLTRGPGPFQVALPQQSMSTGPGTWTVQAVNNAAGAQTLTVSIYCANGVKLPKPKTETITNSTVAAPTFAANDVSATPPCGSPKKKKRKKKGTPRPPGAPSSATSAKGKKKKRGEQLSAGGFSTPPFGTPGSATTLITQSQLVGASWLVRGVNVGPAATLTVTSQGICR